MSVSQSLIKKNNICKHYAIHRVKADLNVNVNNSEISGHRPCANSARTEASVQSTEICNTRTEILYAHNNNNNSNKILCQTVEKQNKP